MKKLLTLAIVGFFLFAWYRLALRAMDPADDTRVNVTIQKGMSTRGIGKFLADKGLVRSPTAFMVYAKLHGTQGGLQAGDFSLQRSMDSTEIVRALHRGYSEEVKLTIPEGFTVKDIDALLAEKGLAEKGAVIACAQTCDFSQFTFLPTAKNLAPRGGKIEGYLFPDTYFAHPDGFDVKAFLERLLRTFDERVVTGLKGDIAVSKRPLHEIVTMGSLIEEETRTNDERPMVSGILWKRFDGKIGLGVDATVRYILDKPTAAITTADLNVDSPYNTRRYRDLPPGPIANAGLESIKAALHPTGSEYLFYLHGTDGKIRYGKTNEEHNENRRKYLQ